MQSLRLMGGSIIAGITATGCAQVTVTSDALVDATGEIADATTHAVLGTSDITTNTADDMDARTPAARRRFV